MFELPPPVVKVGWLVKLERARKIRVNQRSWFLNPQKKTYVNRPVLKPLKQLLIWLLMFSSFARGENDHAGCSFAHHGTHQSVKSWETLPLKYPPEVFSASLALKSYKGPLLLKGSSSNHHFSRRYIKLWVVIYVWLWQSLPICQSMSSVTNVM